MIFFIFLLLFKFSLFSAVAENMTENLSLTVSPQQNNAMRLLICTMSPDVAEVAHTIKKDLEFFGQFAVTITDPSSLIRASQLGELRRDFVVAESKDFVHSKQEMQKLYTDGFTIALFLDGTKKDSHLDWRLYDTSQAIMLKGKKYTKRGTLARGWAHNIADEIVADLTGSPGFFSTKLAYCKEAKMGKALFKHVYIADFNGEYEELLVAVPTVSVAPRWNRDPHNPLLFYSESTNKNMRLMAVNMRKQRRVASNFDGLNMLPAFSHDGKKVVFCASRGQGSCQLFYYEKGVFKQLTDNKGNNVSPTLTDAGDVMYFCSDAKTGQPQIYRFEMNSKKLEQITNGGYCSCPSYSDATQKLAYTKMVGGTCQLFVYDQKTNTHTQITKDAGHKDECSWSPCGNYLLYSVEKNKERRLALLNVHNNQQKFLTAAADACSYPSWSPRYEVYPFIL